MSCERGQLPLVLIRHLFAFFLSLFFFLLLLRYCRTRRLAEVQKEDGRVGNDEKRTGDVEHHLHKRATATSEGNETRKHSEQRAQEDSRPASN